MDIDEDLRKRRAAHREMLASKRLKRGPRMDRVPIRSGVALTARLRERTVANAPRPTVSKGREVHGVRVCPYCAVSGHSLHWHRDVNAARNMISIYKSLATSGEKPEPFCRKKDGHSLRCQVVA